MLVQQQRKFKSDAPFDVELFKAVTSNRRMVTAQCPGKSITQDFLHFSHLPHHSPVPDVRNETGVIDRVESSLTASVST